jgi:hypothetical protein
MVASIKNAHKFNNYYCSSASVELSSWSTWSNCAPKMRVALAHIHQARDRSSSHSMQTERLRLLGPKSRLEIRLAREIKADPALQTL